MSARHRCITYGFERDFIHEKSTFALFQKTWDPDFESNQPRPSVGSFQLLPRSFWNVSCRQRNVNKFPYQAWITRWRQFWISSTSEGSPFFCWVENCLTKSHEVCFEQTNEVQCPITNKGTIVSLLNKYDQIISDKYLFLQQYSANNANTAYTETWIFVLRAIGYSQSFLVLQARLGARKQSATVNAELTFSSNYKKRHWFWIHRIIYCFTPTKYFSRWKNIFVEFVSHFYQAQWKMWFDTRNL